MSLERLNAMVNEAANASINSSGTDFRVGPFGTAFWKMSWNTEKGVVHTRISPDEFYALQDGGE